MRGGLAELADADGSKSSDRKVMGVQVPRPLPSLGLKAFLQMHFLLFYDVVDDYVEKRAPFRAEHLSLIKQAQDRVELVMAGALSHPPDGAVLVFRGPTSLYAEAFAKADP